jgi:hypothetical protein
LGIASQKESFPLRPQPHLPYHPNTLLLVIPRRVRPEQNKLGRMPCDQVAGLFKAEEIGCIGDIQTILFGIL